MIRPVLFLLLISTMSVCEALRTRLVSNVNRITGVVRGNARFIGTAASRTPKPLGGKAKEKEAVEKDVLPFKMEDLVNLCKVVAHSF